LLDSDVGRPVTHISHYLVDCDPIELVRKVQIGGQPLEQKVRTRDGCWYLMRVVPYVVGPRAFSGTVISFVDISEIKLVEATLRDSLQTFANIVNASPALLWMSDPDKGRVWFNEPWLAFTGRSLGQERGDGWAGGVHPDDFEDCLKRYKEAIDNRRPFSLEYHLRRFDGEYRWIYDQGHPRYTTEGEFLGYIGSCLDITDRKQADAVLHASEEESFWMLKKLMKRQHV